MTCVLDRFEGEFAILETEDRTTIQIPRTELPDAKEGSVLTKVGETWVVSDPKTAERAARIREKMNHLWQ